MKIIILLFLSVSAFAQKSDTLKLTPLQAEIMNASNSALQTLDAEYKKQRDQIVTEQTKIVLLILDNKGIKSDAVVPGSFKFETDKFIFTMKPITDEKRP